MERNGLLFWLCLRELSYVAFRCEEQSREAVNQIGCVEGSRLAVAEIAFLHNRQIFKLKNILKECRFWHLTTRVLRATRKKLHSNEFGERPGSFLSWWPGWNWKCWISQCGWISFEDVFVQKLIEPRKKYHYSTTLSLMTIKTFCQVPI